MDLRNRYHMIIGPLENAHVTVSVGNDSLTVASARISDVAQERIASTKHPIPPSGAQRVLSKAPIRVPAARRIPMTVYECIAACVALLACFIIVIAVVTGVAVCLAELVNCVASRYYDYPQSAIFITPFGAFSVMCVTIITMRAASYMCR